MIVTYCSCPANRNTDKLRSKLTNSRQPILQARLLRKPPGQAGRTAAGGFSTRLAAGIEDSKAWNFFRGKYCFNIGIIILNSYTRNTYEPLLHPGWIQQSLSGTKIPLPSRQFVNRCIYIYISCIYAINILTGYRQNTLLRAF